jgi:hypothetical protein
VRNGWLALLLIARYDKIRKPTGVIEDQSKDTRGIDWLNPQPGVSLYE